MTTLHPHWQSTDDADERRVRVTATPSKKSTPLSVSSSPISARKSPIKAASRRPAAFVGVFLCIIAGGAMLQGFGIGNLLGQVDSTAVTIHIGAAGASPVTVTVQPGYTITWTNDDTIPHILTSDTLPTMDGKPFMTSAIFPGSSTHILIPPTALAGAYPYISKTSDSVSGQIIIKTPGAPVAAPSSEPVAPQLPAIPDQQAPSSVATTTMQPWQTTNTTDSAGLPSAPVPEAASVVSNGLPINPHTIGSGEVPLPTRQTGGSAPAITQHTPHTAAASGPEVWVTVLLALGALLFVTRKTFRSF